MILLQDFLFDKIYHLVLRDSASVHLKRTPSVYLRAYLFKVYSFVSCFPKMHLIRIKLKYGTMKLKAYEKIVSMIELGANISIGLFFSAP